jgi:hypothetical protein
MPFDGSFTIRPVCRLERPFIPSVDVAPLFSLRENAIAKEPG